MERLITALYLDKLPSGWAKLSWPSRRPLTSWLKNLGDRVQQIEEWTNNPSDLPRVTWISGFANPQSFLTAICQVTAQRPPKQELDKLTTQTDPTKRMLIEEIEAPHKEGKSAGRCVHFLDRSFRLWKSL